MSDKLTRAELLALCKEKNITGVSSKNKAQLLTLIKETPDGVKEPKERLQRLNYIGSKYQLLDWITSNIQEKTGLSTFTDTTVADLFAGTGIVSYHFRKLGANIISNDAELFSSIIASAFTTTTYNDICKEYITKLNKELETTILNAGYITKHYSPYGEAERKFFTESNAKCIDYIRQRLEELQLDQNTYKFLLASLIVSADAVSNVPAVYGCYLKNFKDKALKQFTLIPVHTCTIPPSTQSKSLNCNVLDETLNEVDADIIYLDPPYNERQYSKNYFPLNMIAKSPISLEKEPELKGKTGIPTDCFISPFCKASQVEEAFDSLFKNLKTKWIFLSYNSESLISREKMCEIMQQYGDVSIIEKDYKRFKSFEYNEDKAIKEYLFCLKIRYTLKDSLCA